MLKDIPNYVNKVNDCENSLKSERKTQMRYICAQREHVLKCHESGGFMQNDPKSGINMQKALIEQ